MPSNPVAKSALPFPADAASAKRAARSPRKAPAKTLSDLDRIARRLEADWQTTLRKHEAAVHRQFNNLRAAVHARKSIGGKKVVELRKALEPRLKPRKGRAKDLRRIEAALDDALGRLG
jgi:hypothetical protein